MERESCIFYKSFYDSIKELDPQDQVQIYNAIFNYQFTGELIELKGVCKSIFTLIIPQLDANNKRYKNGCKGGAPKGNQNATKKQPKNNQKTTKIQPNENENVNDNENVNENNNVNVNENKYYIDGELNDIFEEYLQVRKKLKAVNSDRAIKTLLNKLSKYDDKTKYKMIEQSIVHSWKDIYELKEEKNNNNVFEELLKEENNEQTRNIINAEYIEKSIS